MRRESILKSLSYYTMLTTPSTFSTSRDVLDLNSFSLVRTRRNGRKLNSMAENSILCPNGRSSIICLHGPISNPQLLGRTSISQHHGRNPNSQHHGRTQLLNTMVGTQILNTRVRTQLLKIIVGPQLNLFKKSSKFSAHLFQAWRHPHSGVYYDNGECHILCARVLTAPIDYTPELFTRIVQSPTKLNDKI